MGIPVEEISGSQLCVCVWVGGCGRPECAEGLIVMNVSRTDGSYHGCLGVPSQTLLQQPGTEMR